MPTTAPTALDSPTATTSLTSHHELDIDMTVSSAPQLPTTWSAQARPVPNPLRAPQEHLRWVDEYAPVEPGQLEADFAQRWVLQQFHLLTQPQPFLPSTSHDVFDTRAQVAQGPVEALVASSAGDNTTPSSSPRGLDRGTAFSPTSVAEAILPKCFPASQKPGNFKIELCRECVPTKKAMDADFAIDNHPRALKSRAKPEPAKTPDPVASSSALREFPEILHEAPVPTSPLVSRKKQRVSRKKQRVSRKKQRLEDARKRGLAVPARTTAPAKRFRGSHVTPTDLDVLRGRGEYTNKHPGNVRFRKEVEKVKSLYQTSSTREKNKLSWVSTGESLLEGS